jgi:hypothetical protein
LLLALHWVVRPGVHSQESWVFLVLPDRTATPLPAPAEPVPPKKTPAAAPNGRPIPIPAPAQPAVEKPPQIDWNAEAELTVKRQAELVEAPQPRALDRHGTGIDLNGDLLDHMHDEPQADFNQKNISP